jgi:hypothetical protein
MTSLEVSGPHSVPYEKNARSAKQITNANGSAFFAEFEEFAQRRGCYLFAIRSHGLRATYVGRATAGFGQEVFAADKLVKFNKALHLWPHGTPVLFFVMTPPRISSPPLIAEVEKYLIRSAKRAWPELLNTHHAGPDNWDIRGVTAPHPGPLSNAEMAFMNILKFRAKSKQK